MGIDQLKNGTAVLGIEFGSTRIKSVLIDSEHRVIASGSHEWENDYQNGIWTYSEKAIVEGLQSSYADLKKNVKDQYGVTLRKIGALGISAMMHGYLPFDADMKLLVPFRTWRNTITGEAAEKLTELFSFNSALPRVCQSAWAGKKECRDCAGTVVHSELCPYHTVGVLPYQITGLRQVRKA